MAVEYIGIQIDLSRDATYGAFPLELLKKHYLKDNETSPQYAFARAATNFCYGDYDLAQRIYDYVSKQHACFASPIISNAVEGTWNSLVTEWSYTTKAVKARAAAFNTNEKTRAQPISCFLTAIPDSLKGQIESAAELAELSTIGGGVGQHLGMRGITNRSPGAIPYLKTMDSNILYYHQAGTRRGSVAAYLDISHPDLIEFIGVRTPTGGDINRKSFNVHIAVNITDKFLHAIDNNLPWELIDPHSKEVVEVLSAREIWQQILETRFKTGEPYLHFIDESNRRMHPKLKELGLSIKSSNLCVTGDTIVTATYGDGHVADMNIVDLIELVNSTPGDVKVLSKNLDNNTIEFKSVTAGALTNDDAELIEITDEATGYTITCTPEHKVYTLNRGYVEAQYLTEEDVLDTMQ